MKNGQLNHWQLITDQPRRNNKIHSLYPKMLELRHKGHSMKKIGEILGVSRSAVERQIGARSSRRGKGL